MVAIALRDALAALHALLGDPPYNVVVHTAPPDRSAGRSTGTSTSSPRSASSPASRTAPACSSTPSPPSRRPRLLRDAARVVSVEIRLCDDDRRRRPTTVWAAIEDIETHTEWMADAVAITFRTEQRAGVGTEFECLTRIGPFTTTDVMTVTEWRPGVAMGIEHRGVVTGRGRFTLHALPRRRSPSSAGTSELRFPWWMGGPVGERASRPVFAAHLARQPRPPPRQGRVARTAPRR